MPRVTLCLVADWCVHDNARPHGSSEESRFSRSPSHRLGVLSPEKGISRDEQAISLSYALVSLIELWPMGARNIAQKRYMRTTQLYETNSGDSLSQSGALLYPGLLQVSHCYTGFM